MAESSINGHFTEKTIEPFLGPGGKSREIRQALRGGWLLVVADVESLPILGTGSWLPVL